MPSKQKQFFSIYKWLRKYTVVTAVYPHVSLVLRRDMDSKHSGLPALEEYQIVCHVDRGFDDVLHMHQGDHPKGKCSFHRFILII
jgi:hypothetical protein